MIAAGGGLVIMALLWTIWLVVRRNDPSYKRAWPIVAWGAAAMFGVGTALLVSGLIVWLVQAVA